MIGSSLLSLGLLGLAGLLLDAHRSEWRAASAAPTDDRAARFATRRRRRRMTATAMIAVVGVLIALWPVVPRVPLGVALYMATLVVLAGLIFVLGVADAVASGRYLRDDSRQRLAEHLRLLAELVETQRAAQKSTSDNDGAGAAPIR